MRFFEIVTMIGFLEFQKANCDYAILECGIGGKRDATNIVDEPICSAITSIALDHQAVIGDTVEEISDEKSGVIKKGVPCLVGPTAS